MPNQTQKPVEPKDRPEVLSTLYPKPKTFDEMQRENEAMQQRMLKRQPKYVSLRVALELTALFALFVFTLQSLLLVGFISGVFLIFLTGLMMVGIEWWEAIRIGKYFNAKGFSADTFIVAYFMCAVLLFSIRLTGQNPVLPDLLLVTGLIVTHFIVTWLLSQASISKRLSAVKKLSVMLGTFTALLVASIAVSLQ